MKYHLFPNICEMAKPETLDSLQEQADLQWRANEVRRGVKWLNQILLHTATIQITQGTACRSIACHLTWGDNTLDSLKGM